jgi:hypothetical protein
MKINDHMQDVLNLEIRLKVLKKKVELLNNEPMIDIILKALVKVAGKNTKLDTVKLTKRYLRRFYNIDIDSKVIKSRLLTIMDGLK